MRRPEDDDQSPRRGGSTRRLLPLVGAVTALVAAGVMAKASTGTANPVPTPSAAAAGAGSAQGTVPQPGGGTGQGTGAYDLAPPAGNQVQDVLRAKGSLVYRCKAGRYALAAATLKLYVQNGGYAGTQSAPLTWRFKNGTRVDAALVTQQPAGTTPGQALYRVTRIRGGGANDRATAYIVRRPQSGGLPPASCTTTGKRLSVPFRTTYLFYRSVPGQTPGTAGTTTP